MCSPLQNLIPLSARLLNRAITPSRARRSSSVGDAHRTSARRVTSTSSAASGSQVVVASDWSWTRDAVTMPARYCVAWSSGEEILEFLGKDLAGMVPRNPSNPLAFKREINEKESLEDGW
jgi:hypothetical protein